jgi:hypothetical protein
VQKLIRNKATLAFLTKDGGWTHEIRNAWQFTDEEEAARVKKSFKLQSVELYHCFYETQTSWDFALPLD